jgi:predicted dehydrogenase
MTWKVSRRRFLSTSGAAAVAATVRRTQAQNSANEVLTVGLIGCGGQGTSDCRSILEVGGKKVAVAALADVDQGHLNDFAKFIEEKRGTKPALYKDFRGILDRKDIDAVIVATPDHWHAIATILACQAGKDVYVEKPCSHNVKEGRAMVTAARKYKRIVQVGQQQRSDDHFREAMAYLHNGAPLGRISRTLTINYGNETPDGIDNPPDENDPPPGVDYNLWLGPAPLRKFNRNRFHWSFRWFYDYAGGMMGDWNVHLQDIVHWGMGVTAPKSVCTLAGKFTLKDNRETPDMMDVIYEYVGKDGPFTQVYTMSKCYEKGRYPNGYGTEFFGTEGSLFIDRGGWQVTPEMRSKQVDDPDRPGRKKTIQEPRTPAIKKGGGDSVRAHAKNFLDCVRSRRYEDLHCDIEVGHRIATACHLGNISHRLGNKQIYWDAEKEIITLASGEPDPAANQWLTREYRKGFELPAV